MSDRRSIDQPTDMRGRREVTLPIRKTSRGRKNITYGGYPADDPWIYDDISLSINFQSANRTNKYYFI